MENLPSDKNDAGVENIETWAPEEVFQHLASLYIKNIDIYRHLAVIEIPVPRYYKEFDQIPIKLTFKDSVEKEGSKKKKKKADDDDEPKEIPKDHE